MKTAEESALQLIKDLWRADISYGEYKKALMTMCEDYASHQAPKWLPIAEITNRAIVKPEDMVLVVKLPKEANLDALWSYVKDLTLGAIEPYTHFTVLPRTI
jgi:hypothetical protein